MGSPRKIKEKKVSDFQESVGSAKAVVIAEYQGMTVKQMEELRIKLREKGARLKVLKNKLARIAFDNLGISWTETDLKKQTVFVISSEDAVSGTKVAYDFAKKNKEFKIRSGLFGTARIDYDAVVELASLPSRKELESKFVGTLLAPLSEFVMTLTAPMLEFIATLEAYSAKQAES